MISTDYTLSALKAVKVVFDNTTKYALEQTLSLSIWDVASTTEATELFTSTEGITGIKEVAELETPPILTLSEGYQKTVSLGNAKAGAISISKRLQILSKDSTIHIDKTIVKERDQLLKASVLLMVQDVHAFLNTAFVSTTFASPNTLALCADAQTWATAGSATFDNKKAGLFTQATIDELEEIAGQFVSSTGAPMPLNYSTLVFKSGSPNARMAKKLLMEDISPTNVNDINLYNNGAYTALFTPHITAANKGYWFGMDLTTASSPLYVGVHQYPQMSEPIVENNGAVRSNVDAWYKRAIINVPYNVIGYLN